MNHLLRFNNYTLLGFVYKNKTNYMKHIFKLFLFITTLFGAISCIDSEVTTNPTDAKEVLYNFNVNLTDINTRTIGDGSTVNKLFVALYEPGKTKALETSNLIGVPVENGTAEVSVILLEGKLYDLVFWAQNNEANAYTLNLKTERTIVANYAEGANAEERDAFFLIRNNYKAGHDETSFTLRRPFAQINVANSDEDVAYIAENGTIIEKSNFKVVSNIANTLNMQDGKLVDGTETTVALTLDVIPSEEFYLDGYNYLAMNYLLVDERQLIDLEFVFTDKAGIEYERKYYQVPVQRNYRTNILGQIISSPYDFNVEILPGFAGEENENVGPDDPTPPTPPTPPTTTESDNTIIYTTTDGSVITPNSSAFGANIVSNTWITNSQTMSRAGVTGYGKIVFDADINTIGAEAFRNCSKLSAIVIPPCVNTIEQDAFDGCSSLATVVLEGESDITIAESAFDDLAQDAVVYVSPERMDLKFPIEIRELLENETIEEDETAQSYADNVIYYITTNDQAITDPNMYDYDGISIVSHVYEQGLGTITFSGKLTHIGNSMFYGRETIKSLIIPGSINAVNDSAFQRCLNLEKISFVEEINIGNKQLFVSNNGSNITTIPNSVTFIGVNAFNCCKFQHVVLPEGLTSLSRGALSDCGELLSVKLPSTITSIGDHAFMYCNKIKNIELPAALEHLGKGAFGYCRALESMVIPNKIKELSADLFYECLSLKSVKNPEGLLSFGHNAFFRCHALESINIPSTVTALYGNFYECSSLKKIEIPGSIEALPMALFYYCTSLEEVVIGNGVKVIGQQAFEACRSLKKINLPESIEKIDASAFWKCSALETIVLPNSLKSLGSSVFADASSLKNVNIPQNITTVPAGTFANCISLESITLHENITEISQNAFAECNVLKSITLPSKLTTIGRDAFIRCYEIKSIVIPEGVTSIGVSAFYENKSLESITLPTTLKTIGGSAFSSCLKLKKITIHDGITALDGSTFSDCKELEEVVLPSTLTSIGDRCFANCTALNKISIPQSVTSFGNSTFSSCSSIKSIVIPEGTQYIKEYMFHSCTSLESVVLPSTITQIWIDAFSSCTSLKNINIPQSITSIDNRAFRYCESLTEFHFPKNLLTISENVLEGCKNLVEVTIPEGVTTISTEAFRNCISLLEVTIPSTVNLIKGLAFADCKSCKAVYCKPTTPPKAEGSWMHPWNNTFLINPAGKIYVPITSVDDYTNAPGWGEYYWNIIEGYIF